MEFFHSLSQAPTGEVVELARLAEALGFAGVTFSDHLARPAAVASRYPYSADGAMPAGRDVPYPDPWVLVGALAQATKRLRFLSSVYVLPLRNPFHAAKAIATACVLSGGRVMLGVGVGWMREEFALAGERFEDRGARTDEMLALLRALWSGDDVEHRGRFYAAPALRMLPAPEVPPPILVGGHGDAALRRAARHDGWVGVHYEAGEVPAILARLQAARARGGVAGRRFEVVLALAGGFEPEDVAALEAQGVTALVHPPAPRRDGAAPSLDERRRHLEAFARRHLARSRA
jgi:probable F420-dependent oxidoreductase